MEILLFIGVIALIFVGVSQYNKIKEENFEKRDN
tara:strand:+ start:327 stop:428 length:102 start_codon:yes stop_codon:yes gene_type:complete